MIERVAGKVFVAGDGVQAIEVLSEMEFDLVVTDVRMPVMNGMSLIEEVKARLGRHLRDPLYGFRQIWSAREAYDLGVEMILEKPFGFRRPAQ